MSLLFTMLLLSVKVLSQECPCVETAIIGTGAKASAIHNNKVVAMDNAIINLGESIHLYVKESTGEITWYKDGKLIENTFVSPNETTEYTVKSTLKGCPEVIAKVRIQVEKPSIEELTNAVAIFLNPANNYVTIFTSNKDIKSIQINSLIGEKLKFFEFQDKSKQQTCSLSDLTTGVYIFTIELDGNRTITKKLIKN